MTYRVAPAEDTELDEAAVDLVTVGQALHWFDQKRFFECVKRAGAPGSAIAVWAYDLFTVQESAAVETVFHAFHASVEAFWPPERALVARRYAGLFFPFKEIPVPPITMTAAWSLERTLGYLSTWSAVKRCTQETGRDPVREYQDRLTSAWGDPGAEKAITWPLVLRAGRIG